MGVNDYRAAFADRHIGPIASEQAAMLAELGYESLEALVDAAVPDAIREREPLALGEGVSETEALAQLRDMGGRNEVFTSLIGLGYHDTITPLVILRNVLENPAWYTAYTPYQPEISQGRLEALTNFQTMVTDLTGMEIANASMLDEATAAAEAMALLHRVNGNRGKVFLVDADSCRRPSKSSTREPSLWESRWRSSSRVTGSAVTVASGCCSSIPARAGASVTSAH